jgi:hypothetical protein
MKTIANRVAARLTVAPARDVITAIMRIGDPRAAPACGDFIPISSGGSTLSHLPFIPQSRATSTPDENRQGPVLLRPIGRDKQMCHYSSLSLRPGLQFADSPVQPPDLGRPSVFESVHRSRRANVGRWATVLLLLGGMIETVRAQEVTLPPTTGSGLQIRSVSAYFDYYSASLPNTGGLQIPTNLLPDVAGGASVQAGWTQSRERTVSSFSYTSSLTGRVRYSEWNAWNHALSFTTSRKFAPLWTFGFSASGDFSSQEQALFAPTTLSNVASVPATFDELAAALLASKFTNPQLASVLTSAPLVESPVRNLLYGRRMFTAAAQSSLSHSYSPRLFVSFQAGAGRSQHISQNQAGANLNSYLIPDTTSGNAGLAVSYSLSPQTQLGGSVTVSRIITSLQDTYVTDSVAVLGRTLGRHWLLQIHGGAGVSKPIRQTILTSRTPHPVWGGSLDFKTLSHTFLGSVEHIVSDAYGLGAQSTSSAAFTWRWSRPGRPWWLESSLSWQELQGNGLANISGWRATVGVSRALGPHIVWLTQYAYLNYSGQLQRFFYGQEQSAVRVSLVWSHEPQIFQ